MKRILYLDCFSGISGDMFLGALLDLDVSLTLIEAELAKLGLSSEYHLHSQKTSRSGIVGTALSVDVHSAADPNHQHAPHAAPHEHSHEHSHGRTYADIKQLIETSDLSETIKKLALAVFLEIGTAEASVHGVPLSDVHFHEVGAIDSIVDIVGGAIALDALKIDQVVVSPVSDGSGTIRCQHGVMPVPVPAVMKMLENTNIPYITGTSYTELVTPTGLGIAKTFATSYGSMPQMKRLATGYGFGQREIGRLNALRIILGESEEETDLSADFTAEEMDHVVLLSCHVDNSSAEELGFLMDQLFAKGSLDVAYSPLFMKKNRPGHLLTVVVKPHLEKATVETLFLLSGSIGIRRELIDRHIMKRSVETRLINGENIQFKTVQWQNIIRIYPEYDDLARYARNHHITLGDAKNILLSVYEGVV